MTSILRIFSTLIDFYADSYNCIVQGDKKLWNGFFVPCFFTAIEGKNFIYAYQETIHHNDQPCSKWLPFAPMRFFNRLGKSSTALAMMSAANLFQVSVKSFLGASTVEWSFAQANYSGTYQTEYSNGFETGGFAGQ
ncbi:hypothetical protein Y032_0051g2157 [Ancylostoma ceylanicum]|uniref:Uncharacterized protein n=1 Tax=Ancylostoma ceylanicum TaxID=53326 RepID=A0A016U838_9BILA|nr:hypothetical protein Y032_0051g2157 [Ancylostoma ceylanicum]